MQLKQCNNLPGWLGSHDICINHVSPCSGICAVLVKSKFRTFHWHAIDARVALAPDTMQEQQPISQSQQDACISLKRSKCCPFRRKKKRCLPGPASPTSMEIFFSWPTVSGMRPWSSIRLSQPPMARTFCGSTTLGWKGLPAHMISTCSRSCPSISISFNTEWV